MILRKRIIFFPILGGVGDPPLDPPLITLIQQCDNQQPRCDIAWIYATNYLYHGFPRVKRLNNRVINIT